VAPTPQSRVTPDSAAGAPRSPRRAIIRFFRSGAGAVAALVSFIAAALTSIFLLFPDLRSDEPRTKVGTPTPGQRAAKTPQEVRATLRTLKLVKDVTVRQFLQQTNQSTVKYPVAQLAARGILLFIAVDTRGLKNEASTVVWSLHNADSGDLVSDSQFLGERAGKIHARFDVYRRIARLWIPYPSLPGRFFARIELHHSSDVLAVADSPSFLVRRAKSQTIEPTPRPPPVTTVIEDPPP
jgi:hypothetical protein